MSKVSTRKARLAHAAYSIETSAWDQEGNLLIKTYKPMPEHIGADEDPYAPLLDPRQDDARPG